MTEKIEFSVLSDGRILDLRPMYSNSPPLVYDNGIWTIFEGSQNDIIYSNPIDHERVKDLTSCISLIQ